VRFVDVADVLGTGIGAIELSLLFLGTSIPFFSSKASSLFSIFLK
jgi:hypothetical protein